MKVFIKTGRRNRVYKKLPGLSFTGFTIIELLVVLLLISLLASVVVPVVSKSITRAKEAALKENLFVVRKALDDYYADKGIYPEILKQLVDERYLRYLPENPVADTTQQWQLIFSGNESEQSAGIMDLRSFSTDISSEGSPYNEW